MTKVSQTSIKRGCDGDVPLVLDEKYARLIIRPTSVLSIYLSYIPTLLGMAVL